jgi:hypothetical protein
MMRNTVEYPITVDEIIRCLDGLITAHQYDAERNNNRVGDMTPLLLTKAKELILFGKFDPH